MLTSSTLPLTPSMLAVLVEQRMKTEIFEVYKGDLQWSLLQAVTASMGAKAEVASCSDAWRELFLDESSAKKETIEDVRKAVCNMLNRFNREEGDED